MSIATVVTRGYGTFGSIPEVVTRGYIPGAAPAPVAPTVGGFKKIKRRYRAQLDDGTILWGDSAQQVRELKKRYEREITPEAAPIQAKIKVERVVYEPPDIKFYAQPIPNVFTRIDLKGDPLAHLAKLAIELDDDDEAIQIAMDLLI